MKGRYTGITQPGSLARLRSNKQAAEVTEKIGAGGRGRTGTGLTAQQILSLVRLPVPPRPRSLLFTPIGRQKASLPCAFASQGGAG